MKKQRLEGTCHGPSARRWHSQDLTFSHLMPKARRFRAPALPTLPSEGGCWEGGEQEGKQGNITDALGCLFLGRSGTGEELGRHLTDLGSKVPQQQKASGQQSPEATDWLLHRAQPTSEAHRKVLISYKIGRK